MGEKKVAGQWFVQDQTLHLWCQMELELKNQLPTELHCPIQ